MNLNFTASLSSPTWLKHELKAWPKTFRTDEEMMALAVAIARRNVSENTGGPFGAAIFKIATGELVSAGANSVLRTCASMAHAEGMAIILAQTALGTHDLSSIEGGCVLASSAQPCSQCTHIIWWSGISELLVGARTKDVETLTDFHEGKVPKNPVRFFREREPLPPIIMRPDILRNEACEVLANYTKSGGINYGHSRKAR